VKAFPAPKTFLREARRVFEHKFPTRRTGNKLSARRPALSRCTVSPSIVVDATRAASAHRFAFEPGDHLAHAAMDAGIERNMPGDAAGDVESVGPLPAALVTIG
jgi:hypothetical protein